MMDPNAIPAELWLEIFSFLPAISDVCHVSRTCRRFHTLAFHQLHRHIHWSTPTEVAYHLPVWTATPELNNYVRSLTLCISTLPEHFKGRIVELDGVESYRRGIRISTGSEQTEDERLHNTLKHYYGRRRSTYASTLLHDVMLTRIASFTNLASLTFYNVIFSDRHFTIIHALPLLRTLRLELCVFNSRSVSQVFDHSTLPITELTMVNLRRRVAGYYGRGNVTLDENLKHVLTLALATQLRTLCIDATADVFREVYVSHHPGIGHGHALQNQLFHHPQAHADVDPKLIPPNLQRLYLQRKKFIPGEKQTTVGGELAFPDPRFYAFLTRAQSIRTLSTYHTPGPHHIFAEGMVLNLANYAGPLDSLGPFVLGRPLEGLVVQKCGNGVREGVNALASIVAHSEERLRFLAVEFKVWDSEIIYAIANLFPRLRRLKITFEYGGPDEDKVVSFGPEILSQFPDLHTFQVYALPPHTHFPSYPKYLFDETYSSIEEELRNLVIPWHRYCPSLREVQLITGYKVTRAADDGAWFVERVEQLEEREEFIY